MAPTGRLLHGSHGGTFQLRTGKRGGSRWTVRRPGPGAATRASIPPGGGNVRERVRGSLIRVIQVGLVWGRPV